MRHMPFLMTGLLLLLFLGGRAQTTLSGSFSFGGLTRDYRIYVPAAYSGTSAVPLVFNFHGYTSNAQAQELYGDFRAIADTANFLLVHPQGSLINGSTGWNNFGLPGTAPDDVGFVSALIDTLRAQYNIDTQRIYATGLSNGGFMSYDLACFLSHRLAAMASVAGGMVPLHAAACSPQHPMPVMQIHGTTDAVVTYSGTGGIIGCLHVDSLMQFWVNKNQCNSIPSVTTVPDIVTADLCSAEHHVFSGGQAGVTVELFKVLNGGHTWPGSVFPVPGNGNTNQDFNASLEIWKFFRRYSLGNLSTSVTNTPLAPEVRIYPNPNSGMIRLTGLRPGLYSFDLFDLHGRKVYSSSDRDATKPLHLPALSPGLYQWVIRQSEKVYHGRMQMK